MITDIMASKNINPALLTRKLYAYSGHFISKKALADIVILCTKKNIVSNVVLNTLDVMSKEGDVGATLVLASLCKHTAVEGRLKHASECYKRVLTRSAFAYSKWRSCIKSKNMFVKEIMTPRFYQYRSFEWTYLFKTTNNCKISMRIFNVFQKHMFKCNIPAKFIPTIRNGKFNMPLITKNLPNKFRITEEAEINKTATLLQRSCKIVTKFIGNLTLKVCSNDQFCCPITGDIMDDPVTDNHGHTFERKAIEKHMRVTEGSSCPISRQSITSLTSNVIVKDTIETLRKGNFFSLTLRYKNAVMDEHGRTYENDKIKKLMKNGYIDGLRINHLVPNRIIQDPVNIVTIPNFSLFKSKNSKRAKYKIKKASLHEREKKYDKALKCYIKAYKHTKCWRYYRPITHLFEIMQEDTKASLSYLYLAKYQLNEEELNEAIHTLEIYQKGSNPFAEIDQVLIDLYCATGQVRKAIDLSSQLVVKKQFKEAIISYKQILKKDPLQFFVYFELTKLMPSPVEKAHVLCKGSIEALLNKYYIEANYLAQQALSNYKDSILNEFLLLEVSTKSGGVKKPEQNIISLARKLGREHKWIHMLFAYKIIPRSKYEIADRKNIYKAYTALGQSQKIVQNYDDMFKDVVERTQSNRSSFHNNVTLLHNSSSSSSGFSSSSSSSSSSSL